MKNLRDLHEIPYNDWPGSAPREQLVIRGDEIGIVEVEPKEAAMPPERDEHDEEPADMTLWETVLCFVFCRPGATLCAVVTFCCAAFVVFALMMGWRPFR